MRILVGHNFYRQSGGEDSVFQAEKQLLLDRGHEVIEYVDTNDRIADLGGLEAARAAIWSGPAYNGLQRLVQEYHPDVAHFHNTFALISPSAYYACSDLGVPVVQTLHNYRLMCPVATFYRDGHVCMDCLGRAFAWPGVEHGCYHGSRVQTALVAGMTTLHSALGTWRSKVGIYIALSEFSRGRFIQGGLPASKIVVKPNFANAANGTLRTAAREYALYVGRLSEEKGLSTLLEAWQALPNLPLIIAGDGPLRGQVESAAAHDGALQYVGYRDAEAVRELIVSARFLVAPSLCYENFPMAVAESFAGGLSVVGSRLGAIKEIVADGETGLLFAPGDARDLAGKVRWLWDRPEESRRMGINARGEYEAKYTPERNYEMLMKIYAKAIEQKGP